MLNDGQRTQETHERIVELALRSSSELALGVVALEISEQICRQFDRMNRNLEQLIALIERESRK